METIAEVPTSNSTKTRNQLNPFLSLATGNVKEWLEGCSLPATSIPYGNYFKLNASYYCVTENNGESIKAVEVNICTAEKISGESEFGLDSQVMLVNLVREDSIDSEK